MDFLRGFVGIAALLAIAYALGEDRRAVSARLVIGGILLQLGLAVLLTKVPPITAIFLVINKAVGALQKATDAGTAFVFGYLGGAAPPFLEAHPESSFILAFRAFPLVLVISALAALLLHWGVV